MEFAKRIHRILSLFGIDLVTLVNSLRGLVIYWKEYREFASQPTVDTIPFKRGSLFPCTGDRFASSGQAVGHYFHQDLLVASRIFKSSPKRHVDVGSRVDGFVAHVASYREIDVIDIRPIESKIPNVKFLQADMMGGISKELEGCCDSLSSLHAIEHFGLGRYGDPVCRDGHLKGFANLTAMLQSGGTLYFSVPVGENRIEFNAHRVFSLNYLLKMFDGKFIIRSFSYVDDQGNLNENQTLSEKSIAGNFGCKYGCGIFELIKI